MIRDGFIFWIDSHKVTISSSLVVSRYNLDLVIFTLLVSLSWHTIFLKVAAMQAISNTLREEKSAVQSRATKGNTGRTANADWSMYNDDLEYGLSKPYSGKDKNSFMGFDPDSYLQRSLGSPPFRQLLRQMDSVFLGGARILRTSASARTLAGLYLLLLHGWVLFILLMHVAAVDTGINSSSNLTLSLNSTSNLR